MNDLVHRLPELDKKLIGLLESLDEEEWQRPTVARLGLLKMWRRTCWTAIFGFYPG